LSLILDVLVKVLICHPEPGPELVSGSNDFRVSYVLDFIRLRQNTLWLAAGMNGEANRAEAHQSEGGLAMAEFRLIPHRLR
jgi:hypothetical protein